MIVLRTVHPLGASIPEPTRLDCQDFAKPTPTRKSSCAPSTSALREILIHSTTFISQTSKMSGRPTVGILGGDGKASGSTHPLPAVFSAPIRPDIVQYESLTTFLADETNTHAGPSTPAWPRTSDNPTQLARRPVNRPQPSHGVLVEQWHVSLVSQVVVHTEPVKQHSVINVDLVVCLHRRRSGESGTRRSI